MAGLTAQRQTRPRPAAPRQAPHADARRRPAYVRWVQQSLNRVNGAGLAVDGIQGPRTTAAVRAFQARRGLVVDGIVGPLTERALVAAGAEPPPRPGEQPLPPGPFGPADVVDPRIDIAAQQALLRMRGSAAAAIDATGMLQAVKGGQLAGIFRDDAPPAAERARRLGLPAGGLVPAGQHAALVLEIQEPTRSPAIVFRAGVRAAPTQLDPALRRAWQTFLASRTMVRTSPAPVCLAPGAIPVAETDGFAATSSGLLANLVPALPLCQIRPAPQPRPAPRPTPPPPDPWATPDAVENVIFFPAQFPARVRIDALASTQGGLATDATSRPRLSAIIGPGATPRGIARRLLPLYTRAHAAAGASAGPRPTVDELAQAILLYNELYLPVPTALNYRDGLRLPLPVEIDARDGSFIVNGAFMRGLAARFPAAQAALLDLRPTHLPQPDAAALTTEAQLFVQQNASLLARGGIPLQRMLMNPSEAVFLAFEILRQLGAQAFLPTIVSLLVSARHQVDLLASVAPGQAWLRRLLGILEAPPPNLPAPQTAALARALLMVRGALGVGATTPTPRELPETPQQLASRPGSFRFIAPGTADPTPGRHRMVLGRDVFVGSIGTFTDDSGHAFTGAAWGGRLTARQFTVDHPALLPQGNAAFSARLQIVLAISGNEGLLDAIRMQDAGTLSTGIQQWSVHSDLEIPVLLHRFKQQSPDEFLLFFLLYGLDVRPNGGTFMLQRILPDGRRVDLPIANRLAFFGGVRSGTSTVFATDWAARVREASLASLQYRRAQVLEATARFDRLRTDVGTIPVTRAGRAVRIPVDQLLTSQLAVGLLLDSHINQPGRVRSDVLRAAALAGNQPTDEALEQAIIRHYTGLRRVHQRLERNANIARQRLSADHGSFVGW